MSIQILPQPAPTRSDRIAAQHDALDMFMFLRRGDPAFTAEEAINRAKLPRPDTRVLVRAVMAGVITPEEAVVFWHRMRG